MTQPPPRDTRGGRTVLVGLLLAALGWVGVLVPAWPADAASSLSATVTSAAVTGEGAEAVVTLTATITNDGTLDVPDARAHLWRSTAVLRSTTALERALSAAQTPTGSWQPVGEASSAPLGATGTLTAGETTAVTLSARLADVGIRSSDASYWVGVTVVGPNDTGAPAELAAARTLITLAGDADSARLASVIELSAPPRQLKTDLFLDEGLAVDLQGRLGTLLDAAALGRHDWVVDPSLLAEVADMADGYRVRNGDGSVEGAAPELAAAWLERFAALGRSRGAAGLFGRPDVRDQAVLTAAVAAGRTPTDGLDLPGVAVLDAPGASSLEALAGAGRPVLATGVDAAGAPLLSGGVTVVPVVEPGRVSAAALSDTPLNRTAVLTALARAHGTQVRLLTTADDLVTDATAPAWVTRTTLGQLLETDAVATTELPLTAPPVPVLDDAAAARVAGVVDGLTAYAEASPTAGIDDLPDAVVARAASGWWRGASEAADAWLAAVDRRAGWTALASGIELSSVDRFALAGASGDYPVTVTNRLIDPITVQVVARSDNPQRIRFPQPVEATIPPGASQALLLRAEAAGTGVVTAQVHVASPAGRRLTPDATIVVETTSFGLIGWVLVVASGVVLVVTTAIRIRQVRRQQKAGVHG